MMASSPPRLATELVCCVCTDTKIQRDFPQDEISSDCVHQRHTPPADTAICRDCLQHALEDQIDNKRPVLIQCPICSCDMTYYEVQKWVSQAAFHRYDSLLARHATAGDNTFVQCVNSRCNSGQYHEGGTGLPIVTCVKCKATTCFNHQNLPWHEGMFCDEFDDAAEAARRYGGAAREIRARLRDAGVDPDNSPDASINRHHPNGRPRLQDMLQRYHNACALLEDAEERRQTFHEQPTQPTNTNSGMQDESSNSRPRGHGGQNTVGQPGPSRSRNQRDQLKDNTKITAKQGEQTVKRVSKKCPRCKAPTQRGSGCPHMRCRCGHDWCWKCVQPFSPDRVMDHAQCFAEDADEQLAVQQSAEINPLDIRPPRPQNAFDQIFNHPVFFQPPVELNPADPPDAPDHVPVPDVNDDKENGRRARRPRARGHTRPSPPAAAGPSSQSGDSNQPDDLEHVFGGLNLDDRVIVNHPFADNPLDKRRSRNRPSGNRGLSPPRGSSVLHDVYGPPCDALDAAEYMNDSVRRHLGLPTPGPRQYRSSGYLTPRPPPSPPFGPPPCMCPRCPDCGMRYCSDRHPPWS